MCDHFDHTNSLTGIENKNRWSVLKKQFYHRLKLISSGKNIAEIKKWIHFSSFEKIFYGPKNEENFEAGQKMEQTSLIIQNSRKIDALRMQISSLERKLTGTEQEPPLLEIPENRVVTKMEATDALTESPMAHCSTDYDFLDQLLNDLN